MVTADGEGPAARPHARSRRPRAAREAGGIYEEQKLFTNRPVSGVGYELSVFPKLRVGRLRPSAPTMESKTLTTAPDLGGLEQPLETP